jgi:hypothetical protein
MKSAVSNMVNMLAFPITALRPGTTNGSALGEVASTAGSAGQSISRSTAHSLNPWWTLEPQFVH